MTERYYLRMLDLPEVPVSEAAETANLPPAASVAVLYPVRSDIRAAMNTFVIPDTDIHITAEGNAWTITRVVDEDVVELIDCGIARTRWGMKWAVLRRGVRLIIKAENYKHASPSRPVL